MLLALGLTLLNLVWLGLVIIGLPGTWLMVLSSAALHWYERVMWPGQPPIVGLTTLLVAAGLAALSEVLEFSAGMAGAARAGSSRRGALGALAGGFMGGMVGLFVPPPLIGALLSACVGAAIGAWWAETTGGRSPNAALRSAMGAGLGRLVGTAIKAAMGAVIWLVLAVAAFV